MKCGDVGRGFIFSRVVLVWCVGLPYTPQLLESGQTVPFLWVDHANALLSKMRDRDGDVSSWSTELTMLIHLNKACTQLDSGSLPAALASLNRINPDSLALLQAGVRVQQSILPVPPSLLRFTRNPLALSFKPFSDKHCGLLVSLVGTPWQLCDRHSQKLCTKRIGTEFFQHRFAPLLHSFDF